MDLHCKEGSKEYENMQAMSPGRGVFCQPQVETAPRAREAPVAPCQKHLPSPHPIQCTFVPAYVPVPAYAPHPALPGQGQLSAAAILQGRKTGWVLNTAQQPKQDPGPRGSTSKPSSIESALGTKSMKRGMKWTSGNHRCQNCTAASSPPR